MKNIEYNISLTGTFDISVKAENKEEAIEKAKEIVDWDNWQGWDKVN